ncbi:MAG: preprotein translocase subunit YajC [Clostridia bacterium]|nr:preprotein translocase subunit YajC [Clostridia bacterium]
MILTAMSLADTPSGGYVQYILLGVMLIAVVLLMILPQRKQKKRQQEMMDRLQVGATITTIGGIVGEVVDINPTDNSLVIKTGDENSSTTMKIIRSAVYMVNPDPVPATPATAKAEDEEDEIK